MKQKRKRYSPEFKARVVLEILKEEKSLTELSSEYGIHVNQLRKWKTQFLEQMPQLFQKQNKDQEKMKADYEEQIENLYAEVGRLTTQLSWLKKNLASTTSRQERVNMIERSEEHTTELQSRGQLVCRLLLEKKKNSM